MSDLFGLGGLGGLGGLVKGLTNIMPQDDPNTQLLKLQSETAELRQQEIALYAEIGQMAVARYGLDSFGETAERMKLTRTNLAAAQAKLQEAQYAKEQRDQAEKEALAGRTCPQCGHENPEGTKFCQECGSRLGADAATTCPACGLASPPGTKFCGGCGARLEG